MSIPKKPVKFIFQIILFLFLLVPGVLWATLQKLFTANQKCVKGHVVLITGTARGLGRDLVLRFGRLGAKVACVDIDEQGNKETAQMIKDVGGVATSYTCDVSNRHEIKIMHGQVKEDLGLVDILINNAGVVRGYLLVDPARDQFIINQINVNLMSHIWMIREILPSMIKRNSGHIVAMSSMSSRAGISDISVYTASKWATNGLMESLHNELKLFNMNVNTSTIVGTFVKNDPIITARLRLREILPSMIERNSGHVVAMSSMSSRAGIPCISVYTATKWATNGLMESLHNELQIFISNVKTSTIVRTFVKNDPKVTAQLRLRFPEMPMSVAGDVMVKGILEEQRMISVPGYMLTIVEYLRLLPYKLQSLFSEICYREILPDEPTNKILNSILHKKPILNVKLECNTET